MILPLILKDLRFYAHQRRYRHVQLVILCLLALTLFAAAFEFFARSQTGLSIDVGTNIYAMMVVLFFVVMLCFAVPLQAIDAIQAEKQHTNLNLLQLTQLPPWEFLAGKLIGALLAALWSVWLAVPLFCLSTFTGGLTLQQFLTCGLIFIVATTLFSMIGIRFAQSGDSLRARSRSYAVVLSLTFLPLILSQTLTLDRLLLNLLRLLSPLCVLRSIVQPEMAAHIGSFPIWFWMIGLYLLVFLMLFTRYGSFSR
jgi:ABC-type transport system involved in multi-copper enzyme maturation permease subunit